MKVAFWVTLVVALGLIALEVVQITKKKKAKTIVADVSKDDTTKYAEIVTLYKLSA